MTVEQLLTDLDELVDMVCARVGQDQVILHGHSWGSVLGVLYADRHPERVAAYLGTAQIGDASAAESASYACALAAGPGQPDPRLPVRDGRDVARNLRTEPRHRSARLPVHAVFGRRDHWVPPDTSIA